MFHTNNNIELNSFTDDDIDERTVSEVTKSKFNTVIEEEASDQNVKIKVKRKESGPSPESE